MKIAQIAPIVFPLPVKKYGGTERVIHALTEELVSRGHDVTLFASGDSTTSAHLVAVHHKNLLESGLIDPYGYNELTMLNIGLAYQMQDQFDIIHDHSYSLSLPTANLATTPVVITLHGPINLRNKKLFETLTKPYIVTVSRNQGQAAPHMNTIGTVYHGLDMEDYPFSQKHSNYLLIVGRISMEKGVHHAIEVAEYLGLPLFIAAKIDQVDMPYFNEFIKPRLSDRVRWIGEVDTQERNALMSKALCLLHPVTWREPFGLTLIESMACGAPVVAFRRGSIPEIIKNGKTGFVVEDVAEMAEAVNNIDKIDRSYCRMYALEHFNVKRMTDEYVAIYQKILAERREKTTKVVKPLSGQVVRKGNSHRKQENKLYANIRD